MNVVFMGTPEYASEILSGLIAEPTINVVAVYTQPDKPVGRKKILTPSSVKSVALQNNIEVYQPKRLREEEAISDFLEIACDYVVVAAYGQILPKEILEHAPCINLHASILPQYRGASPIQQTLLNGDSHTGVTAMLMEEGLDTGDILKINRCEVDSEMMAEELFEQLTFMAKGLTLDVLSNFESYTPQKQNEKDATHCKKITKLDGEVAFEDAAIIFNKYRAFTPWPGVYLKNGLKLKKIAFEKSGSHQEGGKIVAIDKDSIVVNCKEDSLRIYTVQPFSKKEMDVISYINGKRLTLEDNFS
ncbi:MAG: methionyl-tRNA formyltransferase [Campylobacterales bacterium]|nr:methionyl-tRNA formyltransferase [Campylobacterales bacterium]